MPDNDARPPGITELLLAAGSDDRSALDQMLPLVYEELRRLAAHYLRNEHAGHTLQPTALVHEAYMRLIDQRRVDWRNRAQFLGLAANMMRRILLNHARDRVAGKRGGEAKQVSLGIVEGKAAEANVDVIALHDALERLEMIDARKSRIVELKYFGGLSTEEIAQVLEVSGATVERDWKFARAWLYDAIEGNGPTS
jgi:RNA polymerase sigma-70 factor, ECF subfamily